jgi:hypothetical protein
MPKWQAGGTCVEAVGPFENTWSTRYLRTESRHRQPSEQLRITDFHLIL